MGQFAPIVFSPPTTTSFPPLIIQARGVAGIASLEVDNGSALTLTIKGDGAVIRVISPYVARFCLNTGGQWQTIEISANTATIQSTDAITIVAYDQAVVPPLLPSYSPLIPYQFTAPVSFGPNGGIYDGSSGTFANPNTGLKLYQDSNGNGRIELWSGGSLIWEWDAVNGLVITMPTSFQAKQALTWVESGAITANLAADLIAGLRSMVLGIGDNGSGGTPPSGSSLASLLATVPAGGGFTATTELQARNKSGNTYNNALIKIVVTDAATEADYTANTHVFNGNILTAGLRPNVSVGAQLGSTGTVSIAAGSTDTAGQFTFTPGGAGIAAGTMAHLTFATSHTNAPFVVTSFASIPTDIGSWETTVSTSGFDFLISTAPSSGLSYVVNYTAIGH